MLLRSGAAVNATTDEGDTTLHVASEAGHSDVVRLLLAAGAAVNPHKHQGYSELDSAVFASQAAVEQLVVAAGAVRTRRYSISGPFNCGSGSIIV